MLEYTRKIDFWRSLMDNIYVNEETLIGEIVNEYPETIEILLGIGMHCLGWNLLQKPALSTALMSSLLSMH